MTDRPIDEQALLAEYEAEKPTRRLSGWPLRIVQGLGVGVSLLALWWVFNPISKQLYLPLFLMIMVSMTFLAYRGWGRRSTDGETPDNPNVLDWALAGLTLIPFGYIVLDWREFFQRAVAIEPLDIVMGTIVVVLVLEATRRTVGWIVPALILRLPGLRLSRAAHAGAVQHR